MDARGRQFVRDVDRGTQTFREHGARIARSPLSERRPARHFAAASATVDQQINR
jgi:hypothetical protein